ncbi:hypothetical protein [Bdellovibrio sp. HCB337]|uniref:hypothetical protein n=1 Tax=Bdellovibrio sp. HCB337 TaxID=3394358 RepID=UPI0039A63B37
MKKVFASLLAGVSLFGSHSSADTKKISDSLVNNLRCDSVSVGSILGSIRPDAFSSRNHLPIRNWGFRSGVFNLGACWGMGSTQRKFFYLLRTGEKTAPRINTIGVLDMVRGASLVPNVQMYGHSDQAVQRVQERPLKNYSIIPVFEDNIRDEFGRNTYLGFVNTLINGATQNVDSIRVTRNLRGEVERSQERHFFRPKNIGMGAGTGAQDPETNKATLKIMMTNAKLNRLTLINLRLRTLVQHILIVKSFTEDKNGNVFFKVYDSNQDAEDQIVYFNKATGHFYAPQVLGIYKFDILGVQSAEPMGVFVVDEEERKDIENSLVTYYKKTCASL